MEKASIKKHNLTAQFVKLVPLHLDRGVRISLHPCQTVWYYQSLECSMLTIAVRSPIFHPGNFYYCTQYWTMIFVDFYLVVRCVDIEQRSLLCHLVYYSPVYCFFFRCFTIYIVNTEMSTLTNRNIIKKMGKKEEKIDKKNEIGIRN